jgi:hypothetical protein
VTVSGGQATSVRRTVRVAAALVAGQALLCGIIGFVTFDDPVPAQPAARAADPRLDGPPLGGPRLDEPGAGGSPGPRSDVPSSGGPSGSAAAHRRLSREATSRPVTRTPRPTGVRTAPAPPAGVPAPPGAGPGVPAPPAPPPVTSPPAALLPSAGDEVPAPVEVGERCDEVGATGHTAAGRPVRCVRGHDGDLRWWPV